VEFNDLFVYRDDVDIALFMAQNTGSAFEEHRPAMDLRPGGRRPLLRALPDAVDDGFVFPKKKLPLARLLFALHGQNPVTAALFGT
jgi:hypothetical protein